MKAKSIVFFVSSYMSLAWCMQSVEVTSYDVAQGSGTLIACYDPAEKMAPCLCDAGCKYLEPTKGDTFKKGDLVAKIVQDICAACKKIGTHEYYVVISHPDEDHYNLIADIVAQGELNAYDVWPKKIILGGSESLYKKEFQEFLEARREGLRAVGGFDDEVEELVTFPTMGGDTTTIIDIARGTNLRYELLPALAGNTVPTKNEGSLVVRAVYGKQSFLFTGDATGKTAAHIMKHCPDLRVDGLSADHHGSSTHESNSLAWLKFLKPQLMVFSSGICSEYRHPQATIVDRVSKIIPAGTGVFRPLFIGSPKKAGDGGSFSAFASNRFGLRATDQALFGTLGQGNLTFRWAVADDHISFVPAPDQLSFPDKKSCLLATLTKQPVGRVVKPENLTELNLSKLGIDDAKDEDRGYITKLFTVLTNAPANVLKNLLLNENAIRLEETIGLIVTYLSSQNNSLQLFNMKNNGLTDESKTRLKDSAPKGCTAVL